MDNLVTTDVIRNIGAVQRIVESGFNSGDLTVEELCSSRFVNNVCAHGVPMGPRGLTDHITMIRNAYPDIHMDVHDIVAAGDTVCVRWVSRGTAHRAYVENSGTGYSFCTSQIAFYTFDDELLVDWSGNYDPLAMTRPAEAADTSAPPPDVWSTPELTPGIQISAEDVSHVINYSTGTSPHGVTVSSEVRLSVHRRTDAFGHTAFAKHFHRLKAAFACDEVTVTRLIASGSQFAVRWNLTGQHIGSFLDMPPTGRRVDMTSSAIATLSGNEIVSWVEILDEVSFLDQTRTHYLLGS
jgi:predicted ester cyclase